MPYIGIFAGLQVSPVLGNVLAFPAITLSYVTGTPIGMWHPAITLSYVTGTPIGMWHPAMWILATILSIILWTIIVFVVDKLVTK
jgi:hypothetical protein